MAGYGLTETCPVATSARTKGTVHYADEEDRLRHLAMAGWPVPGCEIRVVDLEMHDVPRDMAIGRRSGHPRRQRHGRLLQGARATAAAMTGAWLHTGDMAVWDDGELHPHRRPEEGHHHQRGRKYLVHRGGEGHLRPSGGAGMRGGVLARLEMGRSAGGLRGAQDGPAAGAGGTARVSGRPPRRIQDSPAR